MAEGGVPDEAARRHARAWILMVAALAMHVADEVMTDFLRFYNPLVLDIRLLARWFPMPTMTFGLWLGGLVSVVVLLAVATPAVRRGVVGTRALSWLLSVVLVLGALGHLAASIYFSGWLPGTTTAPLLLLAGGLLARATWNRRRSSDSSSAPPWPDLQSPAT